MPKKKKGNTEVDLFSETLTDDLAFQDEERMLEYAIRESLKNN
jgi:hypothetical protein